MPEPRCYQFRHQRIALLTTYLNNGKTLHTLTSHSTVTDCCSGSAKTPAQPRE